MKKFNVRFAREFEVEVQADDIGLAKQLVDRIIAQFPRDTCKLLSIHVEGYIEPVVSVDASAVAELSPEAKVLLRNAELAKNVRELTGDPEAA